MTILLSITGLFKMILMIIGVMVVLRFIGQWMNAKRNLNAQDAHKKSEALRQKQKQYVNQNLGKTHVIPKQYTDKSGNFAEDVKFEEID